MAANGIGFGHRNGTCAGARLDILSKRQHWALVDAARAFIDELLEDYANVYRGRRPENTLAVARCLPEHYRDRYTESFLKQFIVCVVAVSGRLAQWCGEEVAHSTGECLALYAIIEKAVAALMLEDLETGRSPEDDPDLDFRCFEKVAFVDEEYTFLFDSSLADLVDDDTDGRGVPSKVRDWFIPAYGEPAHPYLWASDVPEEEEEGQMAL